MSKRPLHAGTGIARRDRERARDARRQRKAERKGRAWQDIAREREERQP